MSDKQRIVIRVVEIQGRGECHFGHKVGDCWEYPADVNKMCGMLLHIIYPDIRVLRFGGSFPWDEDPDRHYLCCPDPNNPVVVEIARLSE